MELITIRTFDNYISANIVLTKMQDNGIECFLKDEFSSTIMTNAVITVKLLVKDTDAKEAMEMLSKMDTEYLRSVICPNCEEVGLVYKSKPAKKNFMTALLSKLFTNFIAAPEHVYHCNNCGWESKTLPDINSNFTSDETTIVD